MIGEDGRITDAAPERFRGMEVDEARDAVVAALREEGLDLRHAARTCTTCRTRTAPAGAIEPLISLQWFCDMDELREPAIEAVRDGRLRFHPEKPWTGVYLNWLENIRPWCISRQLWWGHQLPVWYRGDETYVGESAPDGRGLGARPGRARHLVLVRPLAVRDARLAGGDRRAARLLPDGRALHGARHHLPLGRAHGDVRRWSSPASCRSPT